MLMSAPQASNNFTFFTLSVPPGHDPAATAINEVIGLSGLNAPALFALTSAPCFNKRWIVWTSQPIAA